MNYIGSKNKLSGFLTDSIAHYVGTLSDKVFCDLFAGTGTVGRSFKGQVAKVIANDIEPYSFCLNRNYIGNTREIAQADDFLEALRQLAPLQGFVYEHYCSPAERLYFSDANGQIIDAIRQQIATWQQAGHISEDLYYFLLASLLESADKVANTASVYGAFLKKIKKTAAAPLQLQGASFELHKGTCEVYQEEANKLIEKIEGDILYLDPPYNARQYGANYHLLNTIALYDHFTPQGKTGLRPGYYKSAYCRRQEAEQALAHLLEKARFRYIFLSYNNEGLIPLENIRKLMQSIGKYDLQMQEYQRFKADKSQNRNFSAAHTIEYLHVLEKS